MALAKTLCSTSNSAMAASVCMGKFYFSLPVRNQADKAMSANGALFIDDNPAPGPGLADPATGKLALAPVLDGLLTDGLISPENHQILTSVRTSLGQTEKSALQVIADSGWDNQLQPGQKLNISALMGWSGYVAGLRQALSDHCT